MRWCEGYTTTDISIGALQMSGIYRAVWPKTVNVQFLF